MIETIKSLIEATLSYDFISWHARGVVIPRSVKGPQENCHEKPISPLKQLRCLMKRIRIGIYLVMEQDEHQSEYVAKTDRRVEFISGFTGSSAFVSVGVDWAELATDSRYYLIASKQLSPEWNLRKLGLRDVEPWEEAVVKKAIEQDVDIGVDPKFINSATAMKIERLLAKTGRKLIPVSRNLIDEVWGSQKPTLPSSAVVSHPIKFTGEKAESKISACRKSMTDEQVNSLIVYSLEEIAWVLNLRGGDIPYVPVFKSFLIITHSSVTLYVDKSKLDINLSYHEGLSIEVKNYDTFFKEVGNAPKPAWVPNNGSWAIIRSIGKNDTPLSPVTKISPINLKRAVKNSTEISGIVEAQLKCSLSILRYLAWLGQHIDEGLNEYEGGLKLLEIRKTLPDFKGNSFETISASGSNASAPHYAPTPMDSATIRRDKIYLLDSGSQFLQGSTDITRTTHYGCPSNEERRAYTLVLKGQLAVANCIFPENTSGWKLDILARQFLWQEGMDYGHGTGHGIGSFLNIHELPLGIGMTSGPESILVPGHFVSDEPGYYKDGEFGVRLESDLLVVPHSIDHTGRRFYKFENMTILPYEPKLIDPSMLTISEKQAINFYHEKCRKKLCPYLKFRYEIEWLERCTEPID